VILAAISSPPVPMFHIGPLRLSIHGVFVALGFLAGAGLAIRRLELRRGDVLGCQSVLMWGLVGAMLGARFLTVPADATRRRDGPPEPTLISGMRAGRGQNFARSTKVTTAAFRECPDRVIGSESAYSGAPSRRCEMLPMPPATQERSRHSDYLAEQQSTNRWIGALTVLIVIVTLIVVASLLFGGGESEPSDVTVDVTAQL
jgi:hypothetical protein